MTAAKNVREALLPCPMCGGRASISTHRTTCKDFIRLNKRDTGYGVNCVECGLHNTAIGVGYATEQLAADRWNTRRTTPPASGEVVGVAEVSDLLAVIHGDGGHYQAEHGTAKAATDALTKFNKIMQDIAAAPQQAEPPVAESATTPSDTVSSGIDPLPTAPYPEPQQAGPTCEESLQVQPPASPAGAHPAAGAVVVDEAAVSRLADFIEDRPAYICLPDDERKRIAREYLTAAIGGKP